MFASHVFTRKITSVAGLPVIAAALMALAGCSQEKAEVKEPVRPVKVVEIGHSDNGRELHYSGSLRARTEMNLGFRVGGKITERLVNIGQRVKEGELLARVDAADFELSLKSTEATLDAARKQVETAELARKRAQQLFASNVVAKSQLEQAILTHDQAVATRDSAISALEQAKNQVSYTALKADHNGIVTAISADVGQVVGSGTPVVTVAIDGEKEVLIAVPEMDISQFRPGKAVKASFWSDNVMTLDGTVREVAASADQQSRTFAVRVSMPNDPRILLGMTATIKASTDEASPSVSIPLTALAKKDDKPIVWTVDRDAQTVHARDVQLADFTDEGVRVTSGLAPGDIVVTAGTQFMVENLKVKLPDLQGRQSASVETDKSQIVQ